MANIIDHTYFFGNLAIGQLSSAAVQSSLTAFIDVKERELLCALLGYKFHKAFTAWNGTDAGIYKDLRDGKEYTNRRGQLAKWKGLKFTEGTTKRSAIANYVYYYWLRDQVSATTGTGEAQAANQNAVASSSAHKQMLAWNDMVDMCMELIEFVLSNQSDYQDIYDHLLYDGGYEHLVSPINTMNL